MFDEPMPGITQEERAITIRVLQYERDRMYSILSCLEYEQACASAENMDVQVLGTAIQYMLDAGQARG